MQGAIKFAKVFPDSNFLAVLPPNQASLERRLRSRGTESAEAMKTRLENAAGEIETLWQTTNLFNYRVINDKLEISKRTIDFLVSALYVEELLDLGCFGMYLS